MKFQLVLLSIAVAAGACDGADPSVTDPRFAPPDELGPPAPSLPSSDSTSDTPDDDIPDDSPDDTACPPVTIKAAGAPVTEGTVDNPRDLVIENGLVRVSHELYNPDQAAAHMLWRWNGSGYQQALDPAYGDWTFFASPFQQGAVAAHVLTVTDDLIEVSFEFDHDLDTGYLQNPPGIVDLDHRGQPVFERNDPEAPVLIKRVRFWKVIGVKRCAEGYFVGYHTVPALTGKEQGERELGLGYGAAVVHSSAGVTARHPEAGQSVFLGIEQQETGPWWVVDVPRDQSSAHVPFARFVALDHPLEVQSYQFDPAHDGSVVVHYMDAEVGPTGRPERYQAFVGAIPYVSADLRAEPSPALLDRVLGALPDSWP